MDSILAVIYEMIRFRNMPAAQVWMVVNNQLFFGTIRSAEEAQARYLKLKPPESIGDSIAISRNTEDMLSHVTPDSIPPGAIEFIELDDVEILTAFGKFHIAGDCRVNPDHISAWGFGAPS